ncbi:hypothetical protein [Amycolatopsis sp. H20-H5]|uniref:hypothetical protein n=1 Tax=Amycolatopsis sp. H20-H5 TaxID=3046309 RepID=UPI002DBD5841|nr:hypothetical protein [Amycolatopsis sp. H20-H5]MEC3980064.1 hypothetical protein [Amycolatopsis sp. H20-H5]
MSTHTRNPTGSAWRYRARHARPVLWLWPQLLAVLGAAGVGFAANGIAAAVLAAVSLGSILTGIVMARRALRHATDRVEAILGEELDPHRPHTSR